MENIDMQNIMQVLGVAFEANYTNVQGQRVQKNLQRLLDEYRRLETILYDKLCDEEITDDEYMTTINSLKSLLGKYKANLKSMSAPQQESDFTDIKDFIHPKLLEDSMFLGFLDRYKAKLKTKADVEAFAERYKTEKRESASRIFGDNIDYIDEDLWGSETFKEYYDRYGLEDSTPDELADFIKQYRKYVLQEISEDVEHAEKTEANDPGIW